MIKPLPKPLEDILCDNGGGINIPPLDEVISNLGFEVEFKSQSYKTRLFASRKRKNIYSHKTQKDVTMVCYEESDVLEFFRGSDMIYKAPTLYYCYVKRKEIVREISLSELI